MPLFTARKELIAAQRLSVDELLASVPGLGVEWKLQERNAEGPELLVDGDMELPQYSSDLVTNGTFDPLYGAEELDDSGAHGTATAANWTELNESVG